MSVDHLPERIDARRLCGHGAHLTGGLPVSQLPPLRTLLAADEGDVAVDLRFARDDEGRRVVAGTIRAEIWLVCQRCLQPVQQVLEAEVALAVLWSDTEAAQLPADLDPLIQDDTDVVVADLIAEELLLALPIVPRHDAECAPARGDSGDTTAGGEAPRQRPFSVLARLKTDTE